MKTLIASMVALGVMAGAANAQVGIYIGPRHHHGYYDDRDYDGHWRHHHHWYHHRHWDYDHWRYWD